MVNVIVVGVLYLSVMVVVMMVTTVLRAGSFCMVELFIFILCVVFVVLVQTANSCSCV